MTNDCCDMTQDKGTHWVKTGGNCDRKHVPMIQTSTGGTELESGGALIRSGSGGAFAAICCEETIQEQE